MTRVIDAALDAAARLIGEALGVDVMREPIAGDPADDDVTGAAIVVALTAGAGTQLGYAMGAAKPFEFEHRAALELLAIDGDTAAMKHRIADALARIDTAIAEDRRLCGTVDFAELEDPDPTDTERYHALAAILTITYTAPSALG